MSARLTVLAVFTMVVGFGAIGLLQQQVDATRMTDESDELLYLPNEKLLNHFTVGQQGLVADLLWLQCIQYTAKEFRGDFKFTWLTQMTDNIVRLDPYYHDVYQWGGQLLAMLKHDSDAGIDLMKRGIPHHPDRWELPFEIARTHILNRNDPVAGARYLAMAATTGDPPPFVLDWAKNLQRLHSLTDLQRAMWQDILDTSEDESMQALAERKLVEADLADIVMQLNKVSDHFEASTGRRAASFEELEAAGLIEGRPSDPLGGEFFVDPDGRFQSTSILDSQVQERGQVLEGWIGQFKKAEGRYPKSLDELVASEHASALPTYPYRGATWRYDPATGSVR
jgi:hypothetical protein